MSRRLYMVSKAERDVRRGDGNPVGTAFGVGGLAAIGGTTASEVMLRRRYKQESAMNDKADASLKRAKNTFAEDPEYMKRSTAYKDSAGDALRARSNLRSFDATTARALRENYSQYLREGSKSTATAMNSRNRQVDELGRVGRGFRATAQRDALAGNKRGVTSNYLMHIRQQSFNQQLKKMPLSDGVHGSTQALRGVISRQAAERAEGLRQRQMSFDSLAPKVSPTEAALEERRAQLTPEYQRRMKLAEDQAGKAKAIGRSADRWSTRSRVGTLATGAMLTGGLAHSVYRNTAASRRRERNAR